ncbi:MAG: hypothetical protein IJ416_07100 [Ruminiclostridium sp.]|nr:hypothetical protein [Ruminiclostridium sp.]
MKEKEKKDKKDKKKKKSKAGKVILFLILIILILLAILYFGDGFGFGSGGAGDSQGDSMQVIATLPEDGDETLIPEKAESPVMIEITESSVKFGDESFADFAAFEEYFYENKVDGAEYILRDNQAIKSVYDSVKTLLDSFGCAYSEEIA